MREEILIFDWLYKSSTLWMGLIKKWVDSPFLSLGQWKATFILRYNLHKMAQRRCRWDRSGDMFLINWAEPPNLLGFSPIWSICLIAYYLHPIPQSRNVNVPKYYT